MLPTALLLLLFLAAPGHTLVKPNNKTQQDDFSQVYDNYGYSYDEEENFSETGITFDDNATVRINKCCDLGEALDEHYRCVQTNETFEFLLERMALENMTLGVDSRPPCPTRKIKELEPTNLAPNGSFEMDYSGVYSMAYHCLDLIPYHGVLDLHLLSCDHDNTGFLTKCCPTDQLLSPDLSLCVALPEDDPEKGADWLPPRSVADPHTFLPTNQYKNQTLATLPFICPGLRAQATTFHQVFSDGTVHVEDKETGLIESQEFECIDRQLTLTNEVTNAAAISCRIPVPKCCPEGEIFSQEDNKCLKANREEDGRMDLSLLEPDSFLIVPDSLPNNLTEAYWEEMSGLELRQNKTLALRSGSASFCIENVLSLKNASVETWVIAITAEEGVPEGRFLFSFPFNNNLAPTQNRNQKVKPTPYVYPELQLSGPKDSENCDPTTLGFYSFLGIISIASLVATVTIYIILPELRNLHGLILISCALSTLFATLFLVIVYNNPASGGSSSCSVLGYFGVFFNLAMFTWMTLMCWDLARTLRRMRPPTSKQQWRKFLAYSCLGWGLPLLASVITGFCQVYVSPESHFNPRIGVKQCFVEASGHRQLIFFHLPMSIIILINAGALAFSIYHIRLTQAGAAAGKRTGTPKTKTQLKLFAKMFLIMGLPWVFEILHHFVHGNHTDTSPCANDFVEIFFRITSAFNLLRGLFLFLVFPCKWSIWQKLSARLGLGDRVVTRSKPGTDTGSGPTVVTRLTRNSMQMRKVSRESAGSGFNEQGSRGKENAKGVKEQERRHSLGSVSQKALKERALSVRRLALDGSRNTQSIAL